ncbi:MAG: heavy-metal-associated domain-containing protein [Myxococcales bacterium]|nr:heavy-metal-associated domain-containing protein [Myxococcales bacterium]
MKTWSFLGIIGALALSGAGLLLPQPSEACCPARAEAAPAKEAAAGIKTATLSVEGMTCASCTVTVRMSLKKLDGVKEATVKLDERRAIVQYDPAKLTPQQMADAVTKAGYKATVVPEQKGS